MIVDALLNFLFYILDFLIGLLPMGTGFPPQVATAVSFLSQYVHVLDFVLPVSTLWDIIFIMLALRLSIWTFHMIIFLRRLVSPFH